MKALEHEFVGVELDSVPLVLSGDVKGVVPRHQEAADSAARD